MKSRLEKVLDKMPSKKVDLKAQKVALTIIDDIDEVLGRGFGMEEFVQEAIDLANEKAMFARDVVRFDMNDAYIEAEELINDAIQKLSDLGVDDASIVPYLNQLNELEQLQETLMREIDNI